ncbi:MAG: ORF6N domain-containing protein [Deltaproteobacteria bacterium]|nr:ORF6N domain-containing protein [Deltaproteobacteria bacterium]
MILTDLQMDVPVSAVRRNIKRFPDDFMFELTKEEFENWRSQFVTSNRDKMGLRYKPMAFTEQGVAMLSSVLRSERAIEVNIAIMRAFVQLREMLASNVELARKLKQMEKKYDEQFKIVFEAIRQLMTPPAKPRKKIRFEVKDKGATYGTHGAKRKTAAKRHKKRKEII